MRLHRIGTARFNNTAGKAFSGMGGIYGPGRWHHKGHPIVYTASSLALATLEILVHINRSLKIQPYVSWVVNVPDEAIETPRSLPRGWLKDVEISRRYGDRWLNTGATVGLRVPSIVVTSEDNVLINPNHPNFNEDWIESGPHPVVFDPRHIDPSTIG